MVSVSTGEAAHDVMQCFDALGGAVAEVIQCSDSPGHGVPT